MRPAIEGRRSVNLTVISHFPIEWLTVEMHRLIPLGHHVIALCGESLRISESITDATLTYGSEP
jgi:hypothetical protein